MPPRHEQVSCWRFSIPDIWNGAGWSKVRIDAIQCACCALTALAVGIVPVPAQENCDPNYTPCVPIASDVDCAGGSGNGPAYVRGPVRVIGRDVYQLDRDGDGIACEPKKGKKK